MREINFITSNKGKIAALKRALSHRGMEDVKILGQDLNLMEPQFDTVADVSGFKARQAYEILKKPVLVEDGGFCIEALNDFPGVYTKYILQTIGAEGLMKLMAGMQNRRARFVGHATYIDENGKMHSFARKRGDVLIASKMSEANSPFAWSDLWKIIYVPEMGKILSEMNETEVERFYNDNNAVGSVQQFAAWYVQNYQ